VKFFIIILFFQKTIEVKKIVLEIRTSQLHSFGRIIKDVFIVLEV